MSNPPPSTGPTAASQPPALLSAADIAARAGCSARTVQRWASRLDLGSLIGSARVFAESDAVAILSRIRPTSGNPDMWDREKNPAIRGAKQQSEK